MTAITPNPVKDDDAPDLTYVDVGLNDDDDIGFSRQPKPRTKKRRVFRWAR